VNPLTQNYTTLQVEAKTKSVVKSLSLNQSSFALSYKKSVTLNPVIAPSDAKNQKLKWTTSDKNIATVSKNGKVTAKKKNGMVTITAATTDGSGKKATCNIYVQKSVIKVQKLKLNKTNISLNEKENLTLAIKSLKPFNATNQNVYWKSSDTKVATVNQSGKIKAIKEGTAVITAYAQDGSKIKASCKIKVIHPAVILNATSKNLSIGDVFELKASVTDDPTNTVTYKSSNSGIAKVKANGKVTARAYGTAVITATSRSGKTASCSITVQENSSAYAISSNSLGMYKGDMQPLTVSNTVMGITWSSTAPDVATVDATGKVTAHAEGTTTIHASVNGRNFQCSVQVYPDPYFDKDTIVFYNDNTATLTLKNAAQQVTWNYPDYIEPSGSNQETITVYPLNATKLKYGPVQVTATCGTKTVTATITLCEQHDKIMTWDEEYILHSYYNGLPIGTFDPFYDYRNLNWSTSDQDMAYVENGLIKPVNHHGLKLGSCMLTAKNGYSTYNIHLTINGTYLKPEGVYEPDVTSQLYDLLKSEETRNTDPKSLSFWTSDEQLSFLLEKSDEWYQGKITFNQLKNFMWYTPFANVSHSDEPDGTTTYFMGSMYNSIFMKGHRTAAELADYLSNVEFPSSGSMHWYKPLLYLKVHYDNVEDKTWIYMVN
jgi:uncharacterized protein YjdB